MIDGIFLTWVVELLLEGSRRAAVSAFSEREHAQVLQQALKIVRAELPERAEREPLIEAMSQHLGGRRAAWDERGAAAPGTLRDGLRAQLEAIDSGTFELKGSRQRIPGSVLLRELGLSVPDLAVLAERAFGAAVRAVAADVGGLPERVRQQDVASVNERLEQIHRDVVTGLGWSASLAGYLGLVEQIAPAELVRREGELAELADFCVREPGPVYAWWQAPAWAGKSALMATLALRPPAGVRVVPFFITARWAGHSDRAAFLEATLGQLAEISGQVLPGALTEAGRQHEFLRLLDEAAGTCTAGGERLVLLVDGLDEDSGVTRRTGGHSIAALLPHRPPTGVRWSLPGGRTRPCLRTCPRVIRCATHGSSGGLNPQPRPSLSVITLSSSWRVYWTMAALAVSCSDCWSPRAVACPATTWRN